MLSIASGVLGVYASLSFAKCELSAGGVKLNGAIVQWKKIELKMKR